MFLNGSQILDAHKSSRLQIEPFDLKLVKPASYLLRIGNRMRRWNTSLEPVNLTELGCSDSCLSDLTSFDEIVVSRGDLILVNSYEKIGIPADLVGFIYTCSHLARAGITVTCDSHLVSPGFGEAQSTHLTFEITSANPSPVKIKAGLPACNLVIATIEQDRIQRKSSVYQAGLAPQGPMYAEESNVN